MLDAQEHQEYTYGSLLQQLSLVRDASRLPLIEVQFNLEKMGGNLRFNGLPARATPNPKCFVNTDLFLNVTESPDETRYTCDFNTDLFDRATVERWMQIWQQLLRGAAKDPALAVSSLPMLDDADRQAVLHKSNNTERDFGPFRSMPQIVAKHAAKTPDRTAVICEHQV